MWFDFEEGNAAATPEAVQTKRKRQRQRWRGRRRQQKGVREEKSKKKKDKKKRVEKQERKQQRRRGHMKYYGMKGGRLCREREVALKDRYEKGELTEYNRRHKQIQIAVVA